MKPSVAAALLSLCLAPATVRASEAPAASLAPTSAEVAAPAAGPAPTRLAEADWSLGAGVGFGYVSLNGFALVGSSIYGSIPSAPRVQASVERRTGPGRWLLLGVSGASSRSRGDAPAGTYAVTRDDVSSLALTAGLRQALTPQGAPVCVSTTLSASAGYLWRRQEVQTTTLDTTRSEAWGLGGALGLAVERELTPGLALRLSTPVLDASWYRSTARSETLGKASRSGGGVGLALAPSLELRLAF